VDEAIGPALRANLRADDLDGIPYIIIRENAEGELVPSKKPGALTATVNYLCGIPTVV
jgi:hypothetical protein